MSRTPITDTDHRQQTGGQTGNKQLQSVTARSCINQIGTKVSAVCEPSNIGIGIVSICFSSNVNQRLCTPIDKCAPWALMSSHKNVVFFLFSYVVAATLLAS